MNSAERIPTPEPAGQVKILSFTGSPPRVLTRKQVAAELQVSLKTVERMLNSGKLPGFKVGPEDTQWRIKCADLQAYIEKQYSAQQQARGVV